MVQAIRDLAELARKGGTVQATCRVCGKAALMVTRLRGARASLHIAERIAALGGAGDAAGVARWQEIGTRLDQLI